MGKIELDINKKSLSAGTIDETLTVKTKESITFNPPVWVLFVNNVNADNVSKGKKMATIKNFNMTVTEGE